MERRAFGSKKRQYDIQIVSRKGGFIEKELATPFPEGTLVPPGRSGLAMTPCFVG